MISRPRYVRWLLVVLAGALLVRLAAGVWWQSRLPGRFGFGDSEGYWALGRAIAQGGPYQYGPDRVFRAPGYPLALAPLFLVAEQPPVLWARAQSALLGMLAVAAVWWLTRVLFDRRAALVAAALAAFYPGSVTLGALVLSEAPFCALMVGHLALWSAAALAPGGRRAAWLALLAGLLAGAATLVRPGWILFAPFALLASLATGHWRRRFLEGALLLAGLILVMAPWWVRNWAVTGHFVPTTLQVGASLYDGLNPQASGASDMSFVSRFTAQDRHAPAGADASREWRLDQRFRREALNWASQHPGEAARLALVKLSRMWNVWPNEPAFSSWPIRLGVLFTYVPILFLAIMGAVRTLRLGWPYWLCWMPAVYLSGVHMVFVSSIRYREPAMLPLMALAALALGAAGSRREGAAGIRG